VSCIFLKVYHYVIKIVIKCGLLKLCTVAKVSKEEKARKEPEVTPISAATPASGNRLRETSTSLNLRSKDQAIVQRTRRQSQISTRQTTPSKSVTTAPQEVKRERWSQRREKMLRLEEEK
jgi:hypothetical protein